MQMIRTVGAVAATGVVSIVLLKLLGAVAAPAPGNLPELPGAGLQGGPRLGVCYFLYRMFRRRQDEMAA